MQHATSQPVKRVGHPGGSSKVEGDCANIVACRTIMGLIVSQAVNLANGKQFGGWLAGGGGFNYTS